MIRKHISPLQFQVDDQTWRHLDINMFCGDNHLAIQTSLSTEDRFKKLNKVNKQKRGVRQVRKMKKQENKNKGIGEMKETREQRRKEEGKMGIRKKEGNHKI